MALEGSKKKSYLKKIPRMDLGCLSRIFLYQFVQLMEARHSDLPSTNRFFKRTVHFMHDPEPMGHVIGETETYNGTYSYLVTALYQYIDYHYSKNIFDDTVMDKFIEGTCHSHSM